MQTQLKTRFARISGQIKGIEKMLDEKRDCAEVVQQIIAARSALTKLGVEILKEETSVCMKRKKKDDYEKILENLFKLT